MRKGMFWLILGVVTLTLIYLLRPVLAPFLLAAVFAYLVDPFVERMSAGRCPRTASVAIVFSVAIVVFLLLVMIIMPLLATQFIHLTDLLPSFLTWLDETAKPWLTQHALFDASWLDFSTLKDTFITHWKQAGNVFSHVVSAISHSTMNFITFISNALLVLVVSFYLLRDWPKITKTVAKGVPRPVQPTAESLVQSCNEVLGAFFKGQLLVMLSLAAVYSVGLWVIGLPMALLVGTIAGLLSIVPYLGFFIGLATAGLIALFYFHDLTHFIYVFLVFGVGQLLETMILTPLLIGDKVGLHPVAIIFALLAGNELFGFVGILLALPVAAVLMVLIRFSYLRYQKSEYYQT